MAKINHGAVAPRLVAGTSWWTACRYRLGAVGALLVMVSQHSTPQPLPGARPPPAHRKYAQRNLRCRPAQTHKTLVPCLFQLSPMPLCTVVRLSFLQSKTPWTHRTVPVADGPPHKQEKVALASYLYLSPQDRI